MHTRIAGRGLRAARLSGARILHARHMSAAAAASSPAAEAPAPPVPVPVPVGGEQANLGVVGWNVYVPRTFVSQAALESFDGVASGKYTAGLGQENMAVAGAQEDIVSMMLTATHGLLEATGVRAEDIGRLEVGTETLVDKSKAVKTSLMRLFGGNTDIEGVDTINACYGGTNALFNCLNWMASPAWDGRYAIVVTGDIAVYEAGPARPTGGAGVVAMLIGPDAPVAFDLAAPRASHMEDAYDFYKPDLGSEYPRVDGHLSNACYLRAVDRCFAALAAKTERRLGRPLDVRTDFQHAIFHQPYQKLVLKSFARYAWNQHRLTGDVSPALDAFLDLPEADTYANRDLEKAAVAAVQDQYAQRVFPSTLLGRQVGNMYTGSLYAGLVSLVAQAAGDLDRQAALMFSYGSGLAATMFPVRFRADAAGVPRTASTQDAPDALAALAAQAALPSLLGDRIEVDPKVFTAMLQQREATYGQFPVQVPHDPTCLADGSFYLQQVDDGGRRHYGQQRSD